VNKEFVVVHVSGGIIESVYVYTKEGKEDDPEFAAKEHARSIVTSDIFDDDEDAVQVFEVSSKNSGDPAESLIGEW